MVRTLKRASQKDRQTLLLPGSTEAEPWEVWATGPESKCLKVCQKPAEGADRHGTLALPVSQVIALPLWLQESDPRQFRGMIALQLESRGLHPRGREAIFDWSIVVAEEARALVLVGVLPTVLPEELETDAYPVFDVSARCFSLPNDALVIWKEQDHLVAAFTRGDNLAYFQLLTDETLTNRGLQDLTCLVAALQMQGIVKPPQQAILWTEVMPAEANSLQALLGVPVRQETRPMPRPPSEAWNLTPFRVGEVKRHRVTRRWWMRAGILAASVVLMVALALVLRFILVQRDIAQLKQWQSAHATALQMVRDTRAAWHDLQPVVDTGSYPLEILLHVSESLPTDQVRMTLFETEGNHLLIKAEAKNLTAAFGFFDALKKNPHLSGYNWEMAQPHSLANDVTQVQIEGTHATHD